MDKWRKLAALTAGAALLALGGCSAVGVGVDVGGGSGAVSGGVFGTSGGGGGVTVGGGVQRRF